MRVVTTAPKHAVDGYVQRWLDSRSNWPKGTEFYFYTEGYDLKADGLTVRDLSTIPELAEWKAKHKGYIPPSWQWNVVGYANKVFATADALYDYDGVGVWIDADCVTYKKIPPGLIQSYVADHYLACFGRTGMYTETGFWVVDCAHEQHKPFLNAMRGLYLSERYKQLPQWHDCMVFDASVRVLNIQPNNLSGEHAKSMHPMAAAELGKYIDHCKGNRKAKGYSPENKYRKAA